jgi:hypothetical protein
MSRLTVVNLNPASRRKNVLPPIVHSVRQHAKDVLVNLLQKLFDNTDDALFEMADRSQSDADQHLFFDSMRQVRLQRPQVIKRYIREMFTNFDSAFAPASGAPHLASTDLEHADVDDLQLVGNEELELSVAISGIVSKVSSQYSEYITNLTARFDNVCKAQTLTDRDNPLGPKMLSHAFVVALSSLDIDIRIKIILLKLFERMVAQRLEPMFLETNKLMRQAGILPELETAGRPPSANPDNLSLLGRAGLPQAAVAETGPVMSVGNPLAGTTPQSPRTQGIHQSGGGVAAEFSVLQQLLAGTRVVGPATGAQYPTGPAAGASRVQSPGEIIPTSGMPDGLGGWQQTAQAEPVQATVPLSSGQLMTLLTALQSEAVARPIDMNHIPDQFDVRSALQDKGSAADGHKPVATQVDDDAISVVGLLFDYILDDKNLAIPMKALISRLQIPVVKLAIIDKYFFANTEHPARTLLNELSSAGIGWSSAQELRRDSLYNKIESIVLDILNASTDSTELYEGKLAELREFLQKDTKRHALVEQRVLENETGKAKARAAKELVQKLINKKASGLRLPSGAGRFVGEHWSKVMVLTATKYGQDNAQWDEQLQALDDLLWSLQPLSERDDFDKRRGGFEQLVQTLETGVKTVLHDRRAREALVAELKVELQQAIDHDEAFLEDDEPIAVVHVAPEEYAELGEIRLTEPVEEPKPKVTIDRAHYEMVKQINIGGWIEVTEANKPALRCKLTTIVEPGNRYVFVNRRGMKVAEYGRLELAELVAAQALSLLDESEVFDRALQAVVGNLRKMQNEPLQID